MLRITWTPSTGAAVTVLYDSTTGVCRGASPHSAGLALTLGTVTRGAHGGFVWQRHNIIETRNGGPTVEMAVWALCAQCRKDGVV